MSKKMIFTLIACGIAVLLLIPVLAVGAGSAWFGLGSLNALAGRGAQGEEYESFWPLEREISGLQIDWVHGDVEIRPSYSSRIRIVERAESGSLEEDQRLALSASGGTLRVKWNSEFLQVDLLTDRRKDLLVELPVSVAMHLDALRCGNSSGDMRVSGCRAETLKLSSSAGSLSCTGLSGGELSLSTASGDILAEDIRAEEALTLSSLSGEIVLRDGEAGRLSLSTASGGADCGVSAETVEAASVSGPVTLRLSPCPKALEAKSVSGDLQLLLPRDSGFSLRYATVSGSLHGGGFALPESAARADSLLVGSGACRLNLETSSGEMRVAPLDGGEE